MDTWPEYIFLVYYSFLSVVITIMDTYCIYFLGDKKIEIMKWIKFLDLYLKENLFKTFEFKEIIIVKFWESGCLQVFCKRNMLTSIKM